MLSAYLIKARLAERVNIMIGNEALIDRDYNTFERAFETLGIKARTSLV
jgi:hypothetical protein